MAPSTPATLSKQLSTLSKQHSTLLPQTATMSKDSIVKFRLFDNVECCFDIVAVFGDNVAGFGNMSNEISSFRQSRNKLNMFSFFRHCRKYRSTRSVPQCCFDIVASMDGAYRERFSETPQSRSMC